MNKEITKDQEETNNEQELTTKDQEEVKKSK